MRNIIAKLVSYSYYYYYYRMKSYSYNLNNKKRSDFLMPERPYQSAVFFIPGKKGFLKEKRV